MDFERVMLDVGFGDGFFRFTPSSGSDSPCPVTAMFDPKPMFRRFGVKPI
jgi:hypothetical protein